MTLKKSAKKFIKNKLPAELKRRREYKRRKAVKEKKQRRTGARDDAKPADQKVASKHERSDTADGAPKSKPKKAVEEMTADEFMEKGFFEALDAESEGSEGSEGEADLDGSGDEDDEGELDAADGGDADGAEDGDDDEGEEGEVSPAAAAAAAEGKKMKGKVAQHRQMLEGLASKDPEFYEFLRKNDANLLSFGDDLGDEDDEADEEESEEEAEAEEEEEKTKADKKEAAKGAKKERKKGKEDEEEGAEGEGEGRQATGSVLTTETLNGWIRAARTGKSHKALARMVRAFRAGCRVADPEGGEAPRDGEPHIASAGVFNRLMAFCFTAMDGLFDALLGRPTEPEGAGGPRPARWSPGGSEHWRRAKGAVKSYLGAALGFLGQVADGSMAALVLRQQARMLPYLALWPPLARKLLKAALHVWSGGGAGAGSERAQVAAFLLMRQLALRMPFPFIEIVLKGAYLTYARNAKFYTAKTAGGVAFMCGCVTELYGLDLAASYQHAFVYIRQLAIHLRAAIAHRTKESGQAVCNWQFVNSLRLWGAVLAAYPASDELRPLIYPFCQVVTGTIRLVGTTRYFPLRFTCVRMLVELAARSRTFVPVAPYLLEVFACAELQRRSKPTMAKPMDLRLLVKVPAAVLPSRAFQEALVQEALELLAEHFAGSATDIAFPEAALPATLALAKWAKKTHILRFAKQANVLREKLEANAAWVARRREAAAFGPKEAERAAGFLADEAAARESPLLQYWRAEKKRIEQRRRLLAEQMAREAAQVAGSRAAAASDEEGSEEGARGRSGKRPAGDGESDEEGSEGGGSSGGEAEEGEGEERPKRKAAGKKGAAQEKGKAAAAKAGRKAKGAKGPRGRGEEEGGEEDEVRDLDLADLSD